MRILLVYPCSPDSFWSFRHALPFIGKKASFPPLGLLTVAALLPVPWEKRLIDMNVRPLADADLAWADYVFISAMSIQRPSVRSVVERCRRLRARTVAGGPLFTASPDEFPDVDHLLLGEAEVTLPRFLADLQLGTPRHLYPAEQRADVRRTPIPLWNLINRKHYAAMNVQYSRGCPFDCEFCDITNLFGRRPRTKSPTQLLAELESLERFGWRGPIFFVDDNFIGDRAKLQQEVLPALIGWMKTRRYPFSFYTETSIDLADEPLLLELMVQAGFEQVFIGIETPHAAGHAESGKAQNRNRDLLGCVRRIQRAGLQVQGGFIVGFDSDPPDIFEQQIDFIQASGIATAMVGVLTALPGTRLHRRLRAEGRLLGESTGNNTAVELNFIPRMDPTTLISGYQQILASIYAPPNYYRRVVQLLREYRSVRPNRWRLPSGHLGALFKSMLRLGLLGRERLHYWKLFFWTLLTRPRLLPLAVTHSIYGFHFRQVVKHIQSEPVQCSQFCKPQERITPCRDS